MTPVSYMLNAIKTPMAYGHNDCIRTVCEWVRIQTGIDPMVGVLGAYDDTWVTENLPKTSITRWVMRAMRKHKFKKTTSPVDGDVGVITTGGGQICAAILGGGYWIWRNHEGGMTAIGKANAKYIAWSVQCRRP